MLFKKEFDEVSRYHFNQAALMTMVPLIASLLLVLLVFVFARLNLYYLEANGLLVNEEIRNAYFDQVQSAVSIEILYLLGVLFLSFIIALVVLRWATAPFRGAEILVRAALEGKETKQSTNVWMSEAPAMDKFLGQFLLQIKGGKSAGNYDAIKVPSLNISIIFLTKFLIAFGALSVVIGYALGMILSTIYSKIITLALQLVQNAKVINHYFLAQQEILEDATFLLIAISFFVYFLLGLQVSRYLSTMTFVFCRALKEHKFPIRLRNSDVYHSLAQTMNQAAEKIS